MRINHNVNRLKIGDKITTDFFEGEENIVRTITELFDDVATESRRGVLFDGGEECPHCHKHFGKDAKDLYTDYIDAAWVIPVGKEG